jgi:Xaa-Pro dipeptidase
MKTPYEIAQLREANRMGVVGHEAAREAFMNGGSELDIHLAYLAANDMIEYDSPYTNIVALDEKAAILHYQNKRRESGKKSKVLLIDAGCRHYGYCSDITRTHIRPGVHPVFRSLLEGMDRLQRDLVAQTKVGVPYADIHAATHKGVLNLLLEHKLCSGSHEDLEKKEISKLFFPHGVGHLLGLQVHDVGGFFKDATGALAPPPEEHKFLRLNRPMAENMVFTIEPGLYFIPVLLEPERGKEKGKMLNWDLIDELTPLGGIRIEDNIHLTMEGPVNLTRG